MIRLLLLELRHLVASFGKIMTKFFNTEPNDDLNKHVVVIFHHRVVEHHDLTVQK